MLCGGKPKTILLLMCRRIVFDLAKNIYSGIRSKQIGLSIIVK
jgi:hypothetical protein